MKGVDVKKMKNDIRERFTLRLPSKLMKTLQVEAVEAGVSTNALILQILGEWKKEWLRENQPSRHEKEK